MRRRSCQEKPTLGSVRPPPFHVGAHHSLTVGRRDAGNQEEGVRVESSAETSQRGICGKGIYSGFSLRFHLDLPVLNAGPGGAGPQECYKTEEEPWEPKAPFLLPFNSTNPNQSWS